MPENRVQFQEGMSEAEFGRWFATEEMLGASRRQRCYRQA